MGLEQRLREGRLARGLSQEQVARELGVTRQAVTKWENGASLPSSANLLRLSALLEIPLEELTGTPAKREDPFRRWGELAVLAAKVAAFYAALSALSAAAVHYLGWPGGAYRFWEIYHMAWIAAGCTLLASALGGRRFSRTLAVGTALGLAAGFLIGAYSIPRSPCGYDDGWIGPLGGWCAAVALGAVLEWREKRPVLCWRTAALVLVLSLGIGLPAWRGSVRFRRLRGQEQGYLAGSISGRADAKAGKPRDTGADRRGADLPEEYEISMPEYHGFMLTWSAGYEDGYAQKKKNDP